MKTETEFFTETAKKILTEFMNFRRVLKSALLCRGADCPICSSFHLPKIVSAIKRKTQVTFVLPAFPGKSPNSRKVLGTLPDFAEQLSLNFLGDLCNRVKDYYLPGVKIIICSDGRVFSDIVGIEENNLTAYQIEFNRIIEEKALTDIST
ncbi:MAG: L-tyrosine/L-tryptophan isonitrile synthase family protein, partial [Alphaproteobacteria bacterium]|nr:L-tyrosine/L-tryptophan isonitrile synthase family protein [Alphaproteobacteria bacterium]